MAKLIADSYYDIGGYRDVYEDRVCVRRLTTSGDLKLVIAAVADGVGGENKGERAAQTAIDALFSYLERSRETDHPSLLTHAVQYANKAVFHLQHETRGSSTTLSVAVLDERSHKLYIANIGDSRIYICRNKKLTQLTIDHSFANVITQGGQISAETARNHPRANVLMRALGMKEQVEVDLGFYVGTIDPEEANARALEGLLLQDGDAILVCSDGLIKDSPKTHKPLVTVEEMVHTLRDKEGKKAAQELVSLALGRGPDDNISVGVIQMPDPWRGLRARRPLIYSSITIVSLMVILGFLMNILRGKTEELSAIARIGTATAERIALVAGFTPTPTNTATATLIPTPTLSPPVKNQVALVMPGERPLLIKEFYTIDTAVSELIIYNRTDQVPGHLYAIAGTRLIFDFVEDQGSNQDLVFQFRIDPNSQILLETGGYSQAYLQLKDADIEFSLQGCFSILYSHGGNATLQALASCYEGSCNYTNLTKGLQGKIPAGQQLLFGEVEMMTGDPQVIPESEARKWISILQVDSPAYDCAKDFIPTLTLEHQTKASPTSQSRRKELEVPTPTPSPIPIISPTEIPSRINTPEPLETNTPGLPINTPEPPTPETPTVQIVIPESPQAEPPGLPTTASQPAPADPPSLPADTSQPIQTEAPLATSVPG